METDEGYQGQRNHAGQAFCDRAPKVMFSFARHEYLRCDWQIRAGI
jgi:hypothetical protein